MSVFTIIVKNPDSIEYSLRRAAAKEVANEIEENKRSDNIEDSDLPENLIDDKYEELKEASSKWVEYNEYVRIEIDTEKGTAIVLEV